MMRGILRSIVICVSILTFNALPIPVSAQEVPKARHGLMWHRTGLPAVFPLQVRTPVGSDFYLMLRDQKTREPALAAYIKGGRFFRVLVPPGTFDLRFAYGADWQGEAALFGPGDRTRFIDLPEALTFKLRNSTTKGGHIVDLRDLADTEMAKARVLPLNLCQTFALEVPRYTSRGPVVDPDVQLNTALEDLEDRFIPDPLVQPDSSESPDLLRRVPQYDLRPRAC
ncbi:hypothetical protein Z945_18 [Sulfitobacter noctilucae]|uniref:hypothetical protein n=1 Tax=Sulfitobacter noctilucae TaxID=1342302 RepID=UPI00069C882F|nr:hypothetical protein [Sulfitobacter noctilucae]KIN75189.1 hypothetical protein Z945_18 [Sulfitobacter noctilucae]